MGEKKIEVRIEIKSILPDTSNVFNTNCFVMDETKQFIRLGKQLEKF